jgi:hypothetical protein
LKEIVGSFGLLKGGGLVVLHSKNGLFWAVEGVDIDADVVSRMRKAVTIGEPLHEHGIV